MDTRKNNKVKIVLTGGHAGATAYAVIEVLRKIKNLEIHFIGASSALEGVKTPTLEENVLPKMGTVFHPINSGRIQRRFTKYTIGSIFRIPAGFIQAFLILTKIKPKVLLSFGGYVSFPVVLVAKFMGIPVVIHEQTASYGRANKLSQIFADKITLARESSLKYFDRKKSVVIGNPVSEEILSIRPKIKLGSPPVIFVTGGSRGSEIINKAVDGILPDITSKYKVVHQVGLSNESKYKNGKNYEVVGMIPSFDWYKYIERADVIISRAGANIVSEVMAAKRPSILIPIPWSFANEQMENARLAESYGIARILSQDELNQESLKDSINDVFSDWEKTVRGVAKKQSPDVLASRKIVKIMSLYLK